MEFLGVILPARKQSEFVTTKTLKQESQDNGFRYVKQMLGSHSALTRFVFYEPEPLLPPMTQANPCWWLVILVLVLCIQSLLGQVTRILSRVLVTKNS